VVAEGQVVSGAEEEAEVEAMLRHMQAQRKMLAKRDALEQRHRWSQREQERHQMNGSYGSNSGGESNLQLLPEWSDKNSIITILYSHRRRI